METIKKQKNILRFTGIFLTLIIISFLCLHCSKIFIPSDKIPEAAKDDFGLMAEAWNAINARYVDRPSIKPTDMTYAAISGMVDSLGDTGHSTFLSPQMLKQEQEYTSGSYKGIGAEIKMKGGHVVIVAPFDGSPAQQAGLRPGQIILKVDGKDIAGLSLPLVVQRIAGEAGTQVTLRIPTGGES